MQVQVILTGDLPEIAQAFSALSNSGIPLRSSVVAEPVPNDEPVKPAAKAVKPKSAAKTVAVELPAPAEDQSEDTDELSSSVAEDFPVKEKSAVTLDHLMARVENVGHKSPAHAKLISEALNRYKTAGGTKVSALEDLEKADYQAFSNDVEMANIAQTIRGAIALNPTLNDAAGVMLNKHFAGYTLRTIPSDQWQKLKTLFEELV
ncbi:hypothetical protein BWI93_05195 [Siphonobacter sp. BAB-5385]|uniref:hypothetical protein n=1 Tax=Siphonobacter sp. BAB-5385 TaxID=1864822 RepID=UPI000B9E116F|nr:hypothetical protein [Siphonobacter sp. BAB-5385]OZI09202.1 hypothetical protein BWI93_05195 [Siphonobacter sp. BAB-5385]